MKEYGHGWTRCWWFLLVSTLTHLELIFDVSDLYLSRKVGLLHPRKVRSREAATRSPRETANGNATSAGNLSRSTHSSYIDIEREADALGGNGLACATVFTWAMMPARTR